MTMMMVLWMAIFSANDLKAFCMLPVQDGGFCVGFIGGVGHALSAYNVRLVGCMPDEVTMSQMRLIFLKYIENHPEHLHEQAVEVVQAAMVTAFPCPVDPAPQIRTPAAYGK